MLTLSDLSIMVGPKDQKRKLETRGMKILENNSQKVILQILLKLFFLFLKKYFKNTKIIAKPKFKQSILKLPEVNIGELISFKNKSTKSIFVKLVKAKIINPLFLSNLILLYYFKNYKTIS